MKAVGFFLMVFVSLCTLSGCASNSSAVSTPAEEVALNPTVTTSSTITVQWVTDQPATSQVEYGPTTSYASTTSLNPNLVSQHSVTLTGLTSGTLYHYRILSSSASGVPATSGDLTFTAP